MTKEEKKALERLVEMLKDPDVAKALQEKENDEQGKA